VTPNCHLLVYSHKQNRHNLCNSGGAQVMDVASVNASIGFYEAALQLVDEQEEQEHLPERPAINFGQRGRVGMGGEGAIGRSLGVDFAAICQLSQFYMLKKQPAEAVKLLRRSVVQAMQEMSHMDAVAGEASRLESMCAELATALELSGHSAEARYYLAVSLDTSIGKSRAHCLHCHRVRSDDAVELLTCGSCKVARYCCADHQV
jgi:hypothetical protein